ncbi:MAG TPA: hypothetical protein VN673_05750, partial [Clostridia bacterium]|nr:hypothetical protein [Clostridia bacterium]
MIKAATIPLGLILLLTVPVLSFAQQQAQESAVNEAVYRQANRITLRQKLVAAQAALDRRDLPAAAKLYDDAWELVLKVGTGVEAEASQVKTGLATARLELASRAQRRGDYREAATQVQDVLRVDPSNAEAIAFRRNNDKLLAQNQGKMVSEEAKGQVKNIVQEKVSAG